MTQGQTKKGKPRSAQRGNTMPTGKAKAVFTDHSADDPVGRNPTIAPGVGVSFKTIMPVPSNPDYPVAKETIPNEKYAEVSPAELPPGFHQNSVPRDKGGPTTFS